MNRCTESNGTYNCHHGANHPGLHECYFTTAGVRKLAMWVDRWSGIRTRPLPEKQQLKA